MTCPSCAMAAVTSAGLGAAVYQWAAASNSPAARPFQYLGLGGTTALFAGTGYAISTSLMGIGIWRGFNFFANKDDHCHDDTKIVQAIEFRPFHISSDVANDPFLQQLTAIPTDLKMIDSMALWNHLFIAADSGSDIFSKGGLNYIFASPDNGPDRFFFSLCSTHHKNGETTVIHGFNDSEDMIYIFCTKKQLGADALIVKYNIDGNFTTVQYDDSFAISILGNHADYLQTEGIILNYGWDNIN